MTGKKLLVSTKMLKRKKLKHIFQEKKEIGKVREITFEIRKNNTYKTDDVKTN